MGEMTKWWTEWKNMVNCPGKLAISGKRPGQNAKFYQSDGKIKPLPKEWQYLVGKVDNVFAFQFFHVSDFHNGVVATFVIVLKFFFGIVIIIPTKMCMSITFCIIP